MANPFQLSSTPGADLLKPTAAPVYQYNKNTPNLSSNLAAGNFTSTPSIVKPTPAPVGFQPKAPEQNVPPAQKVLPANQVKTTTPTAPKTQINQPAPTLPKMVQPTNMATLYGPGNTSTQVKIGSPEASALQTQGYGLKSGSFVAPKTGGTPGVQTQGGTNLVKNADGSYSAPVDTSYAGLLKQLVQQQNNPNRNAATSGLMGVSGTNPAESGPAVDKYNQATQQLQAIKDEYANQKQLMGASTVMGGIKQGQEQLLDQKYSSLIGNAQAAVDQYGAQIGRQISGVQTQEAGYGAAGGLANTGQQLAQSGLTSAAQAAAPLQVGPSSQLVNPQTGNLEGNVSGNTSAATAQSLAREVASGTSGLSYQDAMNQLSQYGPNVQNQLLPEIKKINPNFNVNTSGGTASAQAQNAQIGGTAPTQANQAIYSKALSDYYDLQQSTSNVDQFGTTLLGGMTDKNGQTINPSDVKYANESIAKVRDQLSSQQQAQFDSTFAALKSKVSGLLASGGSEIPSQVTSDANKILDGSAPIGTLSATLSRIQTEGNILLKNQGDKVNQARQGTLSGTGSTSSQPTGNSLYSW